MINDGLKAAILGRADQHNADHDLLEINCGSQVWLDLDRVKVGYARMWHGPFRVADICDDHAVRLEIAGTPYRLLPEVLASKLKPVRVFP